MIQCDGLYCYWQDIDIWQEVIREYKENWGEKSAYGIKIKEVEKNPFIVIQFVYNSWWNMKEINI